ncbi:MAG: hypothetical protein LBC26_06520 [Oscillospiraceae bacterium]|jgi:hypothetical protein|nr:hypothetical protein [Oscillospiraceae bacterium]
MTSHTAATEGRLTFQFHAPWEKADEHVPAGLKAVDFIVDTHEILYLVEVKDFENPQASVENKKRDYKMLTDPEATFPLEIGMKVKDTLLKQYADSVSFDKPIKFLLLIKLAKLEPGERATLYEWIRKYIPMGLKKFPNFTSIDFDLTSLSEMQEKYGFDVSVQDDGELLI